MFTIPDFDGLAIRDRLAFIPVKEKDLVVILHMGQLFNLHSR
jgi:hypothetical protein